MNAVFGHCSKASGHPIHNTDNKITSTWQYLLQRATHLSSVSQRYQRWLTARTHTSAEETARDIVMQYFCREGSELMRMILRSNVWCFHTQLQSVCSSAVRQWRWKTLNHKRWIYTLGTQSNGWRRCCVRMFLYLLYGHFWPCGLPLHNINGTLTEQFTQKIFIYFHSFFQVIYLHTWGSTSVWLFLL